MNLPDKFRDILFFAGLLGFVALSGAVIGISLSTIQQVKARQCPEIQGLAPVSTTVRKDGSKYCEYVKASERYGRAIYEVKL